MPYCGSFDNFSSEHLLSEQAYLNQNLNYFSHCKLFYKIQINFSLNENLRNSILHNLSYLLPKFQFLQSFDLSILGSSDDIINGFNDILNQLGKLKLLRKLKITSKNKFSYMKPITDSQLTEFTERLAKSPTLEILHLNLKGHLENYDAGLNSFTQAFKSLQQLKSFELHLSQNPNLNDTGILKLSSALQSIKSLENLLLDFKISKNQWCSSLTDTGLSDIYSTFDKFSELKRLSLMLQGNLNFSSYGLTKCCQKLIHLSNLKYLSLNFADNLQFSNTVINALKFAFSKMALLETLFLNLSNNEKINNTGMSSLSSGLKSLSLLQDFTFYCRQSENWNSKALTSLAQALSYLQQLSNLNLDFSGNPRIKKMTLIESFGQPLKESSSIKQFSLYYGLSFSKIHIKEMQELLNQN